METSRVQTVNNESMLEVTETVTVKRYHREQDLLRKRAYFEGMIAKGQAGVVAVDALLTQLQNGKR